MMFFAPSFAFANNNKQSGVKLEAFKFIESIGFMEHGRIVEGGKLLTPKDCQRIWKGKSPLGNYVSQKNRNRVVIRLTMDICDDWADDLVELFKSYGYKTTAEYFKTPGYAKYALKSPQYFAASQKAYDFSSSQRVSAHSSGLFSVPSRTKSRSQTVPQKYCTNKPITPQAYTPEFEVLSSITNVKSWHIESIPVRARSITYQGRTIPGEGGHTPCKPVPVR